MSRGRILPVITLFGRSPLKSKTSALALQQVPISYLSKKARMLSPLDGHESETWGHHVYSGRLI
jgi:hypothetical protein